MNARTLIVVGSIVLLALIQIGGWAQTKYVPKENEEIYGTWINNQDKGDLFHPQKVILTAGKVVMYFKISDTDPSADGDMTWQIGSKWTDSEGNVWYKTFGTHLAGMFKGYNWQELDEISKSGTVWESELNPIGKTDFDSDNYPPKIYPESFHYRILYRSAN